MLKLKKHKGFSLPEILIACAILIALSSAAFFSFTSAQNTRKVAQMNNEMEMIANAALAYEALHIAAKSPSTVQELIDGIDANESIDGLAHSKFLNATKSSFNGNHVVDPWNQPYTIGTDNENGLRMVICEGSNVTGVKRTIRYF